MTISLENALDELSVKDRAEVEATAEMIHGEYITLQALRKAKEMTQATLSEKLGKRQSSIAQLEKRSDIMISTVREYIEGLGGTLSLQVQFPGQDPLYLDGLGDTEELPAKKSKSRKVAQVRAVNMLGSQA